MYMNSKEMTKLITSVQEENSVVFKQACDLAEQLHKKLCHENHIDHCGWYYFETGDNRWVEDWTHGYWWVKAYTLINEGVDINNLLKGLAILER